MENNMVVHQKVKKLSYDLAFPLHIPTVYICKVTEITILKRYLHTSVHRSIIYLSQDMETTEVSVDRWMDKEKVGGACVYIYTHYFIYRNIFYI